MHAKNSYVNHKLPESLAFFSFLFSLFYFLRFRFVGVGARRVRSLFQAAKKKVVFPVCFSFFLFSLFFFDF